MTYEQVLRLIIKITESLENNKNYIDQLDEKLGDGTLGSKIAKATSKYLGQIKSLDTKELGVIFNFLGELITKLGGEIGKVYGQILKEFSSEIAGKVELNLKEIILLVDFIIKRLNSQNKVTVEHLAFWNEVSKKLKNQDEKKLVSIAVKDTLQDLQWAYPATRSNSRSLVRVLVVRTILKNL